MNGVKETFELISLIESTIQTLRQDVDCSADISDIVSLKIEILRMLTNSPDEVSSFPIQVEY